LMQRISSEFAGFVRDTGVRAFDQLSESVKELETPARAVIRAWGKLSEEQKNALFDELIATVLIAGSAAPATPAKTAPRTIRRYDPEDVEPTLPAKPRKKLAPKKK